MSWLKKFENWVDSHGKDAGDSMVIGAILGGLLGGALVAVLGVSLMSGELLGIGAAVALLHLGLVLALP